MTELIKQLQKRVGKRFTDEDIKAVWETGEASMRQAFCEMTGWDPVGWVFIEWSRLPQELKRDLLNSPVDKVIELGYNLEKLAHEQDTEEAAKNDQKVPDRALR
jgi:hypothetical protein